MYKTWTVFLIIVPAVLMVGVLIGGFVVYYILTSQIKEWQKKVTEPDKEQVRNMLAALGKKPSEEQVNRFINLTKSSTKKAQPNSKKDSAKKKK